MDAWQCTQDGPVAVLALRRPPTNALDRAALGELAASAKAPEANPVTRVLVITGGLENLFCSGGDLKYWRNIPDPGGPAKCACAVLPDTALLPATNSPPAR
jgi:enoyl-CoA hydratase/carnithine racemase